MAELTAPERVELSATAASDLLNRFPSLLHPQQPIASTSTIPLNTKPTTNELGNGVTSSLARGGRSDGELVELLEAEDRDYQQLIGHFNQAVVELGALKPASHPKSASEMRLAFLREEEAILKAELGTLRDSTRPPPITDARAPDPTDASLAALERTILELELATARAANSLAREKGLLARDEVLMTDAATLNEALHDRLAAKQDQAGTNSPDHLLTRTQGRAARITAAFGSLMAALVQLIDERLAGPGADSSAIEGIHGVEGESAGSDDDSDADDEERKDRSRRRLARRKQSSRLGLEDTSSIRAYFTASADQEGDGASAAGGPRTPADKAMALKQLLENLMNAAVGDKPGSWLRVRAPPGSFPAEAAKFYPPELVDFLLRAGIVLEKPGDQAKVRLVDFGGRITDADDRAEV